MQISTSTPLAYRVSLILSAMALAGCTAAEPAHPSSGGRGDATCRPHVGAAHPASVWLLDVPDPGMRASLVANTDRGIALAYYDGCRIEIPQCRGLGDYESTEVSMTDRHRIESEQQLAAEVPLWFFELGAAFRQSGALDISYAWKKSYRAKQGSVAVGGGPDCGRATHFIAELHVGDFRVTTSEQQQAHAGARAPTWQAGARGENRQHALHEGTDAPLRVKLLPLSAASEMQCPQGTAWNGSTCEPTVACPVGQSFDASVSRCVSTAPQRAFKITVARIAGGGCGPLGGGCNYRVQARVQGQAGPGWSYRAPAGQSDVAANWVIDHAFTPAEIDRGLELTLHHDALLLGGSMSTCTLTATHRELAALTTPIEKTLTCWDNRQVTYRIETR